MPDLFNHRSAFWSPKNRRDHEILGLGEEQMTVGSAQMEVRVKDWPDGRPGIWLRVGNNVYLFTVSGATRLRNALSNQISLVDELDEVVPSAKPAD